MGCKNKMMKAYMTETNEKLFNYIAVVYGAVISYGFYVLTRCLSEFYSKVTAESVDEQALYKFIIQIGLFFLTTLYLIIDIGGMVKVTHHFGYKLHSRFIHDLMVALFFLVMYHEIKEFSVFYIFAFSINLLFAAIWGNNLKEESKNWMAGNSDRFENWGIIIRNSHYLGSFILFLLFGLSLILNYYIFDPDNMFKLNIRLVIMLYIGFYFWYGYFLYYSVTYSKIIDRELSVPTGLPCFLTLYLVENAKKRKAEIMKGIKDKISSGKDDKE